MLERRQRPGPGRRATRVGDPEKRRSVVGLRTRVQVSFGLLALAGVRLRWSDVLAGVTAAA